MWHAQRCLECCESAGIGDWDLAYAYEALARAHAVSARASGRMEGEGARGGRPIADPEDREHFDEDYATL